MIVNGLVTLGLLIVLFSLPTRSQISEDQEDFLGLLNSSSLIDKSLILGGVTTQRRFKIFLLPPKFGKTIALEMINLFLSLPLDPYGRWDNRTYNIRYSLFKRMAISRKKTSLPKINSLFCTKPVIKVDFKVKGKITSKRDAEKRIMFKTHNAFKKYSYICGGANLSRGEQEVCRYWCNASAFRKFPERDVLVGFNRLQYFLRTHFNKKVILLVDNHDDPIENAFAHTNETEFNKTISFMLKFYEKTLTSSDLYNAVIMGTRYAADNKIFNVLPVQFLCDGKRFNHFGLTHADVMEVLRPHRRVSRSRLLEWYAPYLNRIGRRIYNMYTVLNYLKTQVLDYYWIKSIRVDLLPFLKINFILQTVRRALNRHSVDVDIVETHTSADLMNLKRIIDGKAELVNGKENTHNLVFTFFFNKGFLSYVDKNTTQMVLANKEIKDEFTRQIGVLYADKYGIDLEYIQKCSGFFKRFGKTYQVSAKKLEFKSLFGYIHTIMLDYDERFKNQSAVNITFLKDLIYAIASQSPGWSVYTEFHNETLGISEDQKLDFVIINSGYSVVIELEHLGYGAPNGTLVLQHLQTRNYEKLFGSKQYSSRYVLRYVLLGISTNYNAELSCSILFKSKKAQQTFEETVKIVDPVYHDD